MNQNNISAAELFQRVRELLILPELEPKTRNKMNLQLSQEEMFISGS